MNTRNPGGGSSCVMFGVPFDDNKHHSPLYDAIHATLVGVVVVLCLVFVLTRPPGQRKPPVETRPPRQTGAAHV